MATPDDEIPPIPRSETEPMSGPPPNATLSSRGRAATNTSLASISTASSRLRSGTLRLLDVDLPQGAWAGLGNATSKAPTIREIRRGSFGDQGWSEEYQTATRSRRSSSGKTARTAVRAKRKSSASQEASSPFPPLREGDTNALSIVPSSAAAADAVQTREFADEPPTYNNDNLTEKDTIAKAPLSPVSTKHPYTEAEKVSSTMTDQSMPPYTVREDGYIIPPKIPWTTSTVVGLKAFWRWFLTPLGFIITIYCLNVVAWGGMLFLLLCNASPVMCRLSPTLVDCNSRDSPRRRWLEVDSQILNGLFCVTGFGTVPWRFRDWYWLLVYRFGSIFGLSKERRLHGLQRLTGFHRGWFRLPDSDTLGDEDVVEGNEGKLPIPLKKRPDVPLTGVRAPPTKTWKMDFVVYCNVMNTFMQVCLCFFMWHWIGSG